MLPPLNSNWVDRLPPLSIQAPIWFSWGQPASMIDSTPHSRWLPGYQWRIFELYADTDAEERFPSTESTLLCLADLFSRNIISHRPDFVSVQGFPGIPRSLNITASGVVMWLETVAAMPVRVIYNLSPLCANGIVLPLKLKIDGKCGQQKPFGEWPSCCMNPGDVKGNGKLQTN